MKKIKDFVSDLQKNQEGIIEGGFKLVLSSADNALVVGGTQEANNCYGGNCVKGCGANTVAGCGGTTNSAPGCGVAK